MLHLLRRFACSSASEPMKKRILAKIESSLKPTYIQIENESYKHSVPKGSETHFKIVIVSDKFEGNSKVGSHQLVYGLLSAEFQAGLHALSLTTKTPVQWKSDDSVAPSPNCMGGSKHKG